MNTLKIYRMKPCRSGYKVKSIISIPKSCVMEVVLRYRGSARQTITFVWREATWSARRGRTTERSGGARWAWFPGVTLASGLCECCSKPISINQMAPRPGIWGRAAGGALVNDGSG